MRVHTLLLLLGLPVARGKSTSPKNSRPSLFSQPKIPSSTNLFPPKQPHHGTILTGYGSRTTFANTVDVSKTVVTITNKERHVEHEIAARSLDAPLFVRHRKRDGEPLHVYSATHNTNITLRVNQESTGCADSNIQVEEVDVDGSTAIDSLHQQWTPVQSLYGVYVVPSGFFYAWIVSSEPVYEPLSIRRVTEMHLTKVSNGHNCTQPQRVEELRQLKLLRRAIKDHDWFFCEANNLLVDMTRSLQATFHQKSNDALDQRWTPDEGFFWNSDLLTPLSYAAPDSVLLQHHTTAVTSAFCSVQQQDRYDQILISRRSKFRAGTRFTKRGVDATGAVANGVETEQIVAIDNATVFASHVQTRGSLPLFWSSPTDIKTYRPKVRIGTDPLAQARALLAHLHDHRVRYTAENTTEASILIVNLIDRKSDQGRLGRAFDSVLKAVLDVYNGTMTGIEHVWFDFHAEVKSGQWHKLVKLLKQAEPTLHQQGYFLINTTSGNVEKEQDGVIRTNCMDCLDRSNVVQGLFARYILFHQLQELGFSNSAESTKYEENQMSLPSESMEHAHRLLWADNADAISRLYAGTAALKGDFTRTGKRTKKGALDDGMNSLQRYYQNNFLDADRQEGIDLMTGYRPFGGIEVEECTTEPQDSNNPSIDGPQLSIQEAVRKLFLGVDDATSNQEAQQRHIPIQQRHIPIKVKGGATKRTTKWGLRWLPGDLHAQVSSLNNRELEIVDQRATSSSPWWVDEQDEDSDEGGKGFGGDTASRFNANIIRPGLFCAAFFTGMGSPLAVASVVVSLVASSSFRDAIEGTDSTD